MLSRSRGHSRPHFSAFIGCCRQNFICLSFVSLMPVCHRTPPSASCCLWMPIDSGCCTLSHGLLPVLLADPAVLTDILSRRFIDEHCLCLAYSPMGSTIFRCKVKACRLRQVPLRYCCTKRCGKLPHFAQCLLPGCKVGIPHILLSIPCIPHFPRSLLMAP